MNYYDAARIRKKGFANLMADKLASGQGVVSSFRGALSDRSKAKSLAMKEKFDPMNIAKFLTGGSNLAPAIIGRLTGRSKEDIGYFTGKRQYQYTPRQSNYWQKFSNPNMSGGSRKATEVLEKIVSFMEKSREDDIREQETLDSYNELNEHIKSDNHKEVVDVFKEAIKNKRKAMKQMAKETKKRQAQEKAKEKAEKKKQEAGSVIPKPGTPTPPSTPSVPPVKPAGPATAPTTPATPTTPSVQAPVRPAGPSASPATPGGAPAPSVPTARPAPPSAPVTSTASPARMSLPSAQNVTRYGVLTAGMLSTVISKHEGNSESAYGDYRNPPAGKKGHKPEFPVGSLVNAYGDRPEDWSEKTLGKRKKLSDFTFAEVKEYQWYRNNVKESTGAVGIAGFMPTTIFGKDWSGKTGLFAGSGLSWNDKFTEENQKILQGVLNREQDAILKPGLAKMGISEITPGVKLAANYVGAAGVLAVMEEGAKDPTITVKDALMKRFPKNGDPTRGNTINTDLGTTLAKDFVAKKEKYVFDKAVELKLIDKNGTIISNGSVENADIKKQLNQSGGAPVGASPIVNQNNITNRQKNITISSPPLEELNPRIRH